MIMKKIFLIFAIITTFFLSGCIRYYLDLMFPEEDFHYPYFLNNSDDTLYISFNTSTYPDTTAFMFIANDVSRYKSIPKEKIEIYDFYVGDLQSCDTVMVYVYSDSIFKKYSLQQIYENHIVSARYDLSVEDLRMLKEKIPYPPAEVMNEMKIYIPKKY